MGRQFRRGVYKMYLEETIDGIDETSLIFVEPKIVEKWRIAQMKLSELKEQVKYFCLKIVSHNIISNLNEKIEKYMNTVQESYQSIDEE